MKISWKTTIRNDDAAHIVLFAEVGMSAFSFHLARRGLSIGEAEALANQVNRGGEVVTSALHRVSVLPQAVVRWPARHLPESALRQVFTELTAWPSRPRRIVFDIATPTISPRLRAALTAVIAEFEDHPAFLNTDVQVATGGGSWPELRVEYHVDDIFRFAPEHADALVVWGERAFNVFDVAWRAFMNQLPEESPLRRQGEPWRMRDIASRSIPISPPLGRLRAIWLCPNDGSEINLTAEESADRFCHALDVLGEDEDIEAVAMMLISPSDENVSVGINRFVEIAQKWYHENPSTSLRRVFLVTKTDSHVDRLQPGSSL